MKKYIWIFAVILIFGLGGFYTYKFFFVEDQSVPVARGAKLVKVRLGETKEVSGLSLNLKDIVEDSRCPIGSNCIWEGRLKASVDVSTPSGSTNQIYEITQSAELLGWKITLLEAEPKAVTGVVLSDEDYILSFSVKKISK